MAVMNTGEPWTGGGGRRDAFFTIIDTNQQPPMQQLRNTAEPIAMPTQPYVLTSDDVVAATSEHLHEYLVRLHAASRGQQHDWSWFAWSSQSPQNWPGAPMYACEQSCVVAHTWHPESVDDGVGVPSAATGATTHVAATATNKKRHSNETRGARMSARLDLAIPFPQHSLGTSGMITRPFG